MLRSALNVMSEKSAVAFPSSSSNSPIVLPARRLSPHGDIVADPTIHRALEKCQEVGRPRFQSIASVVPVVARETSGGGDNRELECCGNNLGLACLSLLP